MDIVDVNVNNEQVANDYINVIVNKIQILENRYLELKKELNEIKRRCAKIENPKFMF